MDYNHVQNQSDKVSINQAEEVRIQPVKWWSPWEGQQIDKQRSFVASCTPSQDDFMLTRAKQMKSYKRNERIFTLG